MAPSTRDYLIVTASYWGFTLVDGALRMLVLLHFFKLGYSPFTLAFLFLLYEFAGIVANLAGGLLSTNATLTVLATNQPIFLNAQMLTNGNFQLTLSGLIGQKYAIDRSLDLSGWTQWFVITNQTGQVQLTDTNAPGVNVRFYRGRLVLLP